MLGPGWGGGRGGGGGRAAPQAQSKQTPRGRTTAQPVDTALHPSRSDRRAPCRVCAACRRTKPASASRRGCTGTCVSGRSQQCRGFNVPHGAFRQMPVWQTGIAQSAIWQMTTCGFSMVQSGKRQLGKLWFCTDHTGKRQHGWQLQGNTRAGAVTAWVTEKERGRGGGGHPGINTAAVTSLYLRKDANMAAGWGHTAVRSQQVVPSREKAGA